MKSQLAEAARRSLAEDVKMLQVAGARALRRSLIAADYEAELRGGDVDDPIPALLEVRDSHGNRADLLTGLRGMDPEACDRTR